MTKITINFDSNRNVVDPESTCVWSTETYDLDDLSYSEVIRVNDAINEENTTILGWCENIDKLKEYIKDFNEENDIEIIVTEFDYEVPNWYCITGQCAGDYIISTFTDVILNEIDFMPDEYKIMYKIEE